MNNVVVFAAVVACAAAVNLNLVSQDTLEVQLADHATRGLSMTTLKNNVSRELAWIGRTVGTVTSYLQTQEAVDIVFDSGTSLHITSRQVQEPSNGTVLNIQWKATNTSRLEDCVNLDPYNWYGGPQQKRQYWPIEKLNLSDYSYITKEADNCGIAEPYWLSSEGVYIFVDKKTPLFVDQNVIESKKACFVGEVKAPYSTKRYRLLMEYVIGIFDDVRKAHEHAVATVLGKPTGYPDERMITYPIWSTWARLQRNVTHETVTAFADEILRYNFSNSQFEIDDLWEECYGSRTVDLSRFPNMTDTVRILKEKGFRVTIWMHPFVNKECEPWYTDALNDHYLVISESGSEVTSWWNDNGTTAAYIDFTNPEARQWYAESVQLLHDTYGIDSFKFDAGETSWSPQIPVLLSDLEEQPLSITTDYVRSVAQFGSLVEVRSGYRTQDLPIFVRMIDKDSYWNFENGLPTLITTLLQMNMNGYTLVLPDMIGGNGYNDTTPSKNLFIRWMQANIFMPSLQFSFVPWDYDDETVTIAKEAVALHVKYSPDIIKACQRSVASGSPVNAPIWWIAPDDTTAHAIWDEYLLGEDILVAPVITENATSRDIYLPAGSWADQGDSQNIHTGPIWLRDYEVPINELPYFIKTEISAASTPCIAAILLLLSLCINIFNKIKL